MCSTSDWGLNGGSSSGNHEHTGTTLKECFFQQQNRLLYDSFPGAAHHAPNSEDEEQTATTGTCTHDIHPSSEAMWFRLRNRMNPNPNNPQSALIMVSLQNCHTLSASCERQH
jgi:hypothetical protein